MPSAYDVYTFYLEPDDLKQPVTVKIETTHAEEIFNPRLKRNEKRLVAKFEKARKVLPLNKTQVASLIEITKTDDFTLWAGHTVILSKARASNGKDTIEIRKAETA
jgi:hypothetical protein